MRRSSYRGQHKGSTIKARSKIAASRAFRSALAVVLAIGLMPGLSFAGDSVQGDDFVEPAQDASVIVEEATETLEPEPAGEPEEPSAETDAASQEQVAIPVASDAVGTEPAVGQDSGPSDESGNAGAEKSGSESIEKPIVPLTAENVNNSIAAVADDAAKGLDDGESAALESQEIVAQIARGVAVTTSASAAETQTVEAATIEYFKASSVDFAVSFSDSNYGVGVEQSKTVANIGDASKDVVVSPGEEEGLFTGSLTVDESDARVAKVINVTETDKSGDSVSGQYGNQVVVDNSAPTDLKVVWSVEQSDDWLGTVTDNAASYTTSEAGKRSVAAIATITVKDWNLRYPSNALDDTVDAAKITKIETTGTSEGLTPTVIQQWEITTEATDSEPALYTCKIKFSAKTDTVLEENKEYDAKLSVTPVDWATNAADATDWSGTMAITSVDSDPPAITAKKGSADVSTTQSDPTYLKKDETVEISVSDANYDNATLTAASVGETSILELFSGSSPDIVNLTGGAELLASDRPYTISIEATDKVGNSGSYSGYLVYDDTNPTIAVSYQEEASSSVVLKSSDDTASPSGEAFVKDATTVTVNVADAIALDTDPKKTYVKYRKGSEMDAFATIDNSVATIPLAFTDDDVYTVTVLATDKAGNSASYTATITMDNTAPKINVAWPTEDNEKADGTKKYYSKRVAEVTIDDAHFDSAAASQGLTFTGGKGSGTDGAISWTSGNPHTATITYEQNNDSCALVVSYMSKSGVPAVEADESGLTVDNGTYTADEFGIVAKPIVTVSASQDTSVTKTQKTSASSEVTMPVYVLADDAQTLDFTIAVRDVAFEESDYTLTNDVSPADASAAAISWDEAAENSITRTGHIVYSKDCEVSALAIALNAARTFIVDGQESSSWSYKKTIGESDYTGFWVDSTPPTLVNVNYSPAAPDAVDQESGARYYKGDKDANASVVVSERHLDYDGSPVTVELKKSQDGVEDTVTPIYATGENGVFTFSSSDISFEKASGATVAYTLKVTGSDLAGRALVSTNAEGEVKEVMGDADTYERMIVVDDEAPVLKVELPEGLTETADKKLYSGGAVDATITINDAFIDLSDDATNAITITATYTEGTETTEQPLDAVSSLEKKADGTYECKVTLPASSDDSYRTYTLKVSGEDAVGNSLTVDTGESTKHQQTVDRFVDNKYTAVIVVDSVHPKLTVGLAAYDQSAAELMPYKTVAASETTPVTYYYNAGANKITVKGQVEDSVLLLKEGITARVTPSTGAAVENKGPATEGVTYSDIFGVGGYSITAEGEYTFEVAGSDAAHLGLEAAEDLEAAEEVDKNRAAEGLDNGSYKAKVVYDKTRPTVSVTYTVEATERNLAYGAKELVGSDVANVEATFTEAMDTAATTITYSWDGAEPVDASPTWNGNKAIFNIAPSESQTDKICTIAINGCDMAGNNLAGNPENLDAAAEFTAQVEVDKKDPEIKVTTDAEPITPNLERVDYFDGPVAVTVEITDRNFAYGDDANKPSNVITLDGTPLKDMSGADKPAFTDSWTLGSEGVYSTTVTVSKDAKHSFAVTVGDTLGNKTEGIGYTRGEATSFVIDTVSPNIEVKMTPDRAGHEASADYFGGTVTAEITVTEHNFDVNHIDKAISISSGFWADVQKPAQWSGKDGVYTASITFPDNLYAGFYSFTVTAKDFSGHTVTYSYGDKEPGSETAGGKKMTQPDNVGSEFAARFKVDSVAPVIEVTMGETCVGTIGTTDYYGTVTDGALTATVKVTDVNFVTESPQDCIKVKLASSAAYASLPEGVVIDGTWNAEDPQKGVYTAKVKFPENGVGQAYKFRVDVKDVIADKFPTEQRKEVTYHYGNNENMSFVVDAHDPAVQEVTLLDASGNAITPVAMLDGVDYWNYGDIKVKVTVFDTHFDSNATASTIAPTGQYILGEEGLGWKDEGDGRWSTTVEFGENTQFDSATKTITPSALDVKPVDLVYTAANGGVKGHSAMTQYGDANFQKVGARGQRFILDPTMPEFTELSWSQNPVGHIGEVDYFDAMPTLTATVRENNFDVDEANAMLSAIGVKNEPAWSQDESDPALWHAVFDFGQNRVDVDVFESTVGMTAVDKVQVAAQKAGASVNGHTNTYTYKDGALVNGATTGAHAPADRFVVDLIKPTVSAVVDQPVQGTYNGYDYYGTSNDGLLTVTVTVRDYNFDPSAEAYPVNPTQGEWSGVWATNDNYEYTTTVTFAENAGTVSDLAIPVIADKVYTAGSDGNKPVDHATSYDYGASTTDSAGASTMGTGFVLDLTAPNLSVASEATGFSTKWGSGDEPHLFYTANGSGINVTLTDANGIRFASAESPFALSGAGTDVGITSDQVIYLIQASDVGDRDAKNAQMRSALVRLTDYAGNYSVWNISSTGLAFRVATGNEAVSGNTAIAIRDGSSVHPSVMVLDQIAPSLSWGSAPAEGQYYNTPQSAVLNLAEMNFDYLRSFDGGRTIATVTHYANNAGRAQSTTAIPASSFSGSGTNWTTTIPFNEEGHYTVSAQFEDIAGNMSNMVTLNEFTLDWTAPTVTVTWDNNNARNGMYYNASRTATITVTEHNFLASDFTITTTGNIGGWSSNGDTHTCIVSFTTDGRYTLTVAGHDRAGNAMATVNEPEFVVDLTAPKITFSLAEDQSAYSRDTFRGVAITYEDEANLDMNALEKNLVGAKHGARTDLGSSGPANAGNSATDTYSDTSFPDEVESDDIYTLTAHMSDMAGNEADGTITFSLNRWGSNFIVMDADRYEAGYLDEAPEVVVREINVTGAPSENHGVSITQGLSTQSLEQISSTARDSRGFYIQSGNDASNWAQYDYHIVKRNFMAEDSAGEPITEDGNQLWVDGNYHIIVNSTDEVGNSNTSAHYLNPETHNSNASAEVAFILDTTAPIVDGFNVAEGGMYDSSDMTVEFSVTDNIGVKAVNATISDGDGASEVEAELNSLTGRYEVNVPAKSWNGRSIEVVATDFAGNKNTDEDAAGSASSGIVSNFKVTTDFVELHLPFVIGGAVVVVALAAGAVVFVRRRSQG